MHEEDLPSLGATVGPWLILNRLDSGSYGVVFHARRATAPESPPVALKAARQPEDPRFKREAEVLQHSHHPSIPRYVDMGLWTGPSGQSYPYLVMESVEGSTLYPWFRAQPRSSLDVLQVLEQLAGALASAHDQGVLHRDIKGHNIRVTPTGRAVLLDWGSCWMPSAQSLTDTLVPPGTSAYRPPEQRGFMYAFREDMEARWESRPSDDLYSLGVTLYRLVTGSYLPPCTEGAGLVEREVPKPTEWVTVSSALEALILRLISDDREARGTAEQLLREAQALVQAGGPELHQPILPKRSARPIEDRQVVAHRHDEERHCDAAPSPLVGERRPLPASLLWAGVFTTAGLVMGLMVSRGHPVPEKQLPPWIATPEEVGQFAPDAGVGEEALLSVQDMPRAAVPPYYFGRSMPKDPIPGQKKPPCEPVIQRAINGGCWFGPSATKKPPCGPEAVDYDDGCYMPVFPAPRQPTSEPP